MKFSTALYASQTDFFDANVYDKSRTQIYRELAALARASADVSEADVMSKLDRVVEEGSLNTGNATTQTLSFTSNSAGRREFTSAPPPRSTAWSATRPRGGRWTSGRSFSIRT